MEAAALLLKAGVIKTKGRSKTVITNLPNKLGYLRFVVK
jgi:hypothetical protein